MGMKFTVASYAEKIGKSRSTARRHLQKLVDERKASWTTSFGQVDLPRGSYGMKQPPPYIVILYTVF